MSTSAWMIGTERNGRRPVDDEHDDQEEQRGEGYCPRELAELAPGGEPPDLGMGAADEKGDPAVSIATAAATPRSASLRGEALRPEAQEHRDQKGDAGQCHVVRQADQRLGARARQASGTTQRAADRCPER